MSNRCVIGFLLSCFAIPLAIVGCSASHHPAIVRPPNILLVMTDDHSWEHVGAYGDAAVSTPDIDRLADEGIRFRNAYAASPSCTPSRGALITGQHIYRLKEGGVHWGPNWVFFGDIDPTPAKQFMEDHREGPDIEPLFALSFGKVPGHELYSRTTDPDMVRNLADDPAYAQQVEQLAGQMKRFLAETGDPRMGGKHPGKRSTWTVEQASERAGPKSMARLGNVQSVQKVAGERDRTTVDRLSD